MNLLSRRSVLAIAAVVDVALHSRSAPVAAKALAAPPVIDTPSAHVVATATARHTALRVLFNGPPIRCRYTPASAERRAS